METIKGKKEGQIIYTVNMRGGLGGGEGGAGQGA